jgi:hypothetical protein
MTVAPTRTFLRRSGKPVPATRGTRPKPSTAWTGESAQPVEIVANDSYCADLLLEYAAPLFPVEVVADTEWVVRLQPPAGGAWVLEVLSLVERWLEAARLPCAKVLYGDRSYLIRTSTDSAHSRAYTEPQPVGFTAVPTRN